MILISEGVVVKVGSCDVVKLGNLVLITCAVGLMQKSNKLITIKRKDCFEKFRELFIMPDDY